MHGWMPQCCFNQLDLEHFSCFIERKKPLPSVLPVHWSHDILFLCIPPPPQEIDGKSLLLMQRTDVLTGLSIRLGPALKIYEYHIKLLQQYHFEEDEGDSFMGWEEWAKPVRGRERTGTLSTLLSQPFQPSFASENKTTLWERRRAWTISGERREAEMMTQLSWHPYPGYLVIQKTGLSGLKAHFLLSSCLSDPTPSFSLTIVHCLFGGKMRQYGFPPLPNLHLSWNNLCFSTQMASPFPLPNSSIW